LLELAWNRIGFKPVAQVEHVHPAVTPIQHRHGEMAGIGGQAESLGIAIAAQG
jgi:hypothetical protein